jgi:hypothetical protein
MATTKATTAIYENITLTAGAGDNISSAVDLTTGYGGELHIKITNGATGPTVPAQCQIQGSADDSEYYDYGGALVADTDNNGVYSWSVDIPIGIKYIKLVAGSNTGQDVTIDADIANVTAIT